MDRSMILVAAEVEKREDVVSDEVHWEAVGELLQYPRYLEAIQILHKPVDLVHDALMFMLFSLMYVSGQSYGQLLCFNDVKICSQ